MESISMYEQTPYKDEYDALRSIIEDSDKTYKQVAFFLWPKMLPESAYSRLKACLDPTKRERLTFGEIIKISKFCEQPAALFHFSDELSFHRPQKKPIEKKKFLFENEALNNFEARLDAIETMLRGFFEGFMKEKK